MAKKKKDVRSDCWKRRRPDGRTLRVRSFLLLFFPLGPPAVPVSRIREDRTRSVRPAGRRRSIAELGGRGLEKRAFQDDVLGCRAIVSLTSLYRLGEPLGAGGHRIASR